jgi:hypothetical protein
MVIQQIRSVINKDLIAVEYYFDDINYTVEASIGELTCGTLYSTICWVWRAPPYAELEPG